MWCAATAAPEFLNALLAMRPSCEVGFRESQESMLMKNAFWRVSLRDGGKDHAVRSRYQLEVRPSILGSVAAASLCSILYIA